MMGEGPMYLERKIERFECGDCGKGMTAGSLDTHRMVQHGKAKAKMWSWTDATTGGGGGGGATTYWIEFPKGGEEGVPSGGLPGRAGRWTAMRVYFWRRHVRDVVIILEEGNLPHQRCPRYDMLVPWRS